MTVFKIFFYNIIYYILGSKCKISSCMHCLCEKIPEDIGISYFVPSASTVHELEENQSESKALIDSRFLNEWYQRVDSSGTP